MNADNVDNAHQLAARFRLSYDATQAILKPLKPVMTMPYGRGKLRLYDRTAAEQTIRKALEKTTPKPAAESPPVLSLAKVTEAVDDLGDKVTELESLCKQLIEQNKVLNAQSNRTQTMLNAICAELGIKVEH